MIAELISLSDLSSCRLGPVKRTLPRSPSVVLDGARVRRWSNGAMTSCSSCSLSYINVVEGREG
jgi:hypothetical protein